ncbi:MAG: NADP-dependent oxidoreductase [Dermatophilaceae bacterium]
MSRIVVPTGFGGPEQLVLRVVPTPEPAPGQVRVAVRAIGVNPIDWKLYSGGFGTDTALLAVMGHDAAGVVDKVGEGVTDWAVGDEVIVNAIPGSGYADHVLVPPACLVRKPPELSFVVAAALPIAGGTAFHAVEAAGVSRGDTVLVHGAAGGVGSLAVQLAAQRGARVIGTASPANHDYLRALGAEPVAYGEGLVERLRAAAPEGVDAAIDTVGSDEALDTSVELVADRQRVVTIVAFSRAQELGITAIGGGPGADPGTELRNAARATLATLAAQGHLRVEIARTYPLTETAAAHAASRAGHTRGKLVVVT